MTRMKLADGNVIEDRHQWPWYLTWSRPSQNFRPQSEIIHISTPLRAGVPNKAQLSTTPQVEGAICGDHYLHSAIYSCWPVLSFRGYKSLFPFYDIISCPVLLWTSDVTTTWLTMDVWWEFVQKFSSSVYLLIGLLATYLIEIYWQNTSMVKFARSERPRGSI